MKKRVELDCHTCVGRSKGVFCELHGEALDLLDESKNANIYKRGQTLFLEGNPPFGLYCVHSGKVKITKTGPDGKETIVRIADSGDLLGHRSMFSESPYTASATVIEDAHVCFVGKETVQNLIKKDPTLSFQIINSLSKQMGAAEERLTSMAQKSVRERFAEMLLILKENYGEKVEQRIKLNVRLTREEMASMIGAAPENLIRMVTEFKKDGLIEQEGRDIYLLDVEKIEDLAAIEF